MSIKSRTETAFEGDGDFGVRRAGVDVLVVPYNGVHALCFRHDGWPFGSMEYVFRHRDLLVGRSRGCVLHGDER